ncbi:MAG: hypothetical protein AAF974_00055 [Cyanobacteria bacterium P01_E01_bin.34]
MFAQSASQNILDNSRDNVLFVRESFNSLWESVLTGSLYDAIADLGVAFALVFAGWTLFKVVLIETADDGVVGLSTRWVPDLIWAIVLLILLSSTNGTPRIANYTLDIRQLINNSSTYLLTALNDDLTLEQASGVVDEASLKSQAQILTNDGLRECALIQEESLRNDCLLNVRERLDRLLGPYYNRVVGNWATDLYRQLVTNIDEARQEVYGSAGFWSSLFRGMGSVIRPAVTASIIGVLYAWAGAVEWLLEISLLLTAVLGPLFLGLSLLPQATKPVMGWLTALGSIGLGKVAFNIVSGIAAYLILLTPSSNPLLGALVISVAAPILALAMSAGGGWAIYSGLLLLGAKLSSRVVG